MLRAHDDDDDDDDDDDYYVIQTQTGYRFAFSADVYRGLCVR